MDSKQDYPKIFCSHGNYPDTCAICLEVANVKPTIETKATAAPEFRINEVRDQIASLERQDGHDITEADLSLEQTIPNEEKQRTTFIFKLNEQKAMKYFNQHTFYHFMNEPFHGPPRFEIERVYCNSDDLDDVMTAETIFEYVNGSWKKT
jgi:hypothetical protein